MRWGINSNAQSLSVAERFTTKHENVIEDLQKLGVQQSWDWHHHL